MSGAELKRLLGEPQGRKALREGGEELIYRVLGLILGLDASDRIDHITMLREEADPFLKGSHPGRTAEGLGLDSTPEQFIEAWGEPDHVVRQPSPFYEGAEIRAYCALGVSLLLSSRASGQAQLMGLRIEEPSRP